MKGWVICIGKYPQHAKALTKGGVNTECIVDKVSYKHQLRSITIHKKRIILGMNASELYFVEKIFVQVFMLSYNFIIMYWNIT